MARKFNRWSFYLCFLTLLIWLNLIIFNWSIVPAYILWSLAATSLIFGKLGLKDKTNKRAKFRSWFTIILSSLFSIVLFLGVIRLIFVEDLFQITHSPDGNYKIEFYLTNGGATTSFGVLGKLDGPLWFKKTINDDYHMDKADVEWINEHTISINNHILDLKKGETYSD
ncbi:hypothetical protein BFG57_16880 [Bacillus solimangrovi]|uniref:Uncharacterized protein n=1 Tax=Bacillus solimangrovi TaxID=1305675 RepID=A0A1E5LDB4_9BACI|nr:hypothetical protein BFG57_16880 [Bacillus solimangrovi]